LFRKKICRIIQPSGLVQMVYFTKNIMLAYSSALRITEDKEITLLRLICRTTKAWFEKKAASSVLWDCLGFKISELDQQTVLCRLCRHIVLAQGENPACA
jgi:hypothetical protein